VRPAIRFPIEDASLIESVAIAPVTSDDEETAIGQEGWPEQNKLTFVPSARAGWFV